jgi:NADH-quinone oxidoreductase subunit M
MELLGIPILNAVAYLPLAGFFLILLLPKTQETLIKWVANVTGLLGFLVSVPLITSWYDTQVVAGMQNGMRYTIDVSWIQSLGVRYSMGIDGISLLLVLLTTMLGSVAILSSWSAITVRVKEYYAYLLLLQTGMLGVFMATDLFLFYIFWEVMLVPMYFLIGVWGGPRKLYAAIKFFLYTLLGSVLMLLAILALYFKYVSLYGWENRTFSYFKFLEMGLDPNFQFWAFLAFFIGFAIKVPMFPFHTWLPDAHVEAPTAGSVILAGVLLKMGTYGFVRFSLPLFPDATREFLPFLMILCIVGIIYGALVAMMQKDMKKLVAYSSVSHLGFCMLGVFAGTAIGIQGGVIQMINHGISTGALFMIVGNIYERRHTRMIEEYGGLSHHMPVYATIFLIMTLSSIGLPGLNGFIGEFMILQGTFQNPHLRVYAILAASGIILGAAYMLWLYQRVMFGKCDKEENRKMKDLNLREVFTYVPLIILAVWIGIFPSFWLKYLNEPAKFVVDRLQRSSQQLVVQPPAAPMPAAPAAVPSAPAAAVK